MRRILLGAVLLSIVGGFAFWRARRKAPPLESAYVGERNLMVYSSNAQVRETLQTLNFGDRVQIVQHGGETTDVRTPAGVEGWVITHDLILPDLWQRMTALTAQAKLMPVQAWAHTKVLSNLRVEPGRDGARIFQIGRDTKVSILGRKVLAVTAAPAHASPASGQNADEESESESESPATANGVPKKEDWVFALADVKDYGPLAGWIVERFVSMDLPDPLENYASSAGMRVSAWFQLNSVDDPVGGAKPQYLVLGSRGPEGDACDFTTMRAYTWGEKRQRYETAYVESNFCGQMPVRVTPATQPGGDAEFKFDAISESGKEERVYHLHQTMIRRTDEQRHEKRAKHGGAAKTSAKTSAKRKTSKR